jgi:GrpB-like predicted nucleotidyltransferase (UPF0157 family)
MDEVVIVEYDPEWPILFDRESELIRSVLDKSLITRIEHFGSTAIPGLAAKPIVDILVGVSSLTTARQVTIAPLEKLGYAYWADNLNLDRMFFVKGLPPNSPRTHHLHMVDSNSILWKRLLFRDYLREHSDEAARYERLKKQLARSFSSDREAYTLAKTDYINSVMQKLDSGSN